MLRPVRVGLVFLVLVMAVQTAWSLPFCTTRNVQGTYAIQVDGSILAGALTGPFMRLGWFTNDGAGNVTASTLAVYGGINFGIENYDGTYTVTSDCSIEFNLFVPAPINANARFKGTVANDGEDIMFMLMSTENPLAEAKTTVLAHARKQKLSRCGVRDLNGAYRVELNGWVDIPPAGGGPTPVRLLGRVVADGRGGLSSSFIETVGANFPYEEIANGSYTVNPDCTFAMSIPLANLPFPTEVIRGSLIGLGREAFVVLNPQGLMVPFPPFGTVEVNGVVATGSMIQQSVSNADR